MWLVCKIVRWQLRSRERRSIFALALVYFHARTSAPSSCQLQHHRDRKKRSQTTATTIQSPKFDLPRSNRTRQSMEQSEKGVPSTSKYLQIPAKSRNTNGTEVRGPATFFEALIGSQPCSVGFRGTWAILRSSTSQTFAKPSPGMWCGNSTLHQHVADMTISIPILRNHRNDSLIKNIHTKLRGGRLMEDVIYYCV